MNQDGIIELGRKLIEHGDEIFVRLKMDGRWQNVPLSKCPAHVVVGYALTFLAMSEQPTLKRAGKREADHGDS